MNSMTIPSIDSTFAAPTSRRLFAAYLAETRYELMRQLRNPGLAIPILLLPVGLYALFAFAVGAEWIAKDANVGTFLFTAFGIMAVTMPALFGIGATLAVERDSGMLRLKRAQPAPAGAWLVAKIACGIGLGVIAYAPMVIVALASGKLALTNAQVAAMSGAMLAGTIPFCAMGLMVGTLVSGSAAPGYANLIYLPGCYLSGLFFPLPASMHWQAPIWPQFHLQQLALHAAGVTKFPLEPILMAVGSLLGYTVLFSAVAIWRLARKG
jgi:ABC-2 type transport system permease protein